ncbi:MAG: methylenetetrahydrofolate reductase [Nitrosarchaeum sp.]|nr:methylenetetrahydrofolate reductase [Nitrosarchaeum sp.]
MIIYEINPPKIPEGKDESSLEVKKLLDNMIQRISNINSKCDGIHITDSVLGTRRIPPLVVGEIIKIRHPHLQITTSLRVRDKDMDKIKQEVQKSINLGLDGILVLKGDPSKDSSYDSGLIPSKVVQNLNSMELAEKTNLFLSLPSNPNFDKIQKKISAAPSGFMTQVIHSVKQVERISERLRPEGFRIIPCLLLPSEKNVKSASFLNLDWSEYANEPINFIKEVHHIAGDVLLTSPNDFAYAQDILFKI